MTYLNISNHNLITNSIEHNHTQTILSINYLQSLFQDQYFHSKASVRDIIIYAAFSKKNRTERGFRKVGRKIY